MAASTQKSRRPSLRQRLWRWKWMLLAAVVALVALGWYGYQQLQVHNQYEQFVQAKDDLHTLSREIVAAVGQPAEQKATQTCGYTSEEFSRGARFCDVDEFLLYHTDDLQSADAKAESVAAAVKASKVATHYQTDTYLPDATVRSSGFALASYTSCSYQAVYFANREHTIAYPHFLVDDRPGLSIDLNCGGPALSEYFEVKN